MKICSKDLQNSFLIVFFIVNFRIDPEENERGVFVCQPGSPVATSLCEGTGFVSCSLASFLNVSLPIHSGV